MRFVSVCGTGRNILPRLAMRGEVSAGALAGLLCSMIRGGLLSTSSSSGNGGSGVLGEGVSNMCVGDCFRLRMNSSVFCVQNHRVNETACSLESWKNFASSVWE